MALDKSLVMKASRVSPELPWNNWDPKDIGPVLMNFMEDMEPYYAQWSQVWYQNFQFLYGNQSLRWSKRYGYAVDFDYLRREPSLNMRAQTNITRTVAESLASMIYADLPTWEVDAAEESSVKGKRWQRIIQKMLDAYMVRLNMDKEFASAALAFVVFSQMAYFVDWDDQGGELLEIPQWKKNRSPIFTDYMAPNQFTGGLLEVPTQALDSMGQPLFEERWEPVLDGTGRQVVDQQLTGDATVEVLTPFEYRRQLGTSAHKSKYWQRIRLIDYDQFLDEYGQLEGRTAQWEKVRPVYDNPSIYKIAMRHFMRLQMTTPPNFGDAYQRPQSVYRTAAFRNKVLIVDHYDKPHKIKWPTGRRIVVVNGEAVIVGKPRYFTSKQDGWHPFVESQWMNVPPSSMSSGPLTDVVAKNRELNVADSLNATALRRNMGSALLIKTGSGLDPQRLTGEPGMTHVVTDPNAFRWLHDDMPISPVVAQMRQAMKDDIYDISGAGDALRGERPPNVSAGYAMRQLAEREERRLSMARKNFGTGVAGLGEKLWQCVKQNCVKLDDQVMGFLQRSASGEYQPQDIVAILSTPTTFGVDINIRPDSMAAKSKATGQATLMELLNGPAAARAQNPKILDEVLKYFDVEHLRDDSAAHRDRASRENEIFQDMLRLGPNLEGISKPIVLFEDDDDIHLNEHIEFLISNSDEITRNEMFLKEFLQHTEMHRLQKQEKQGQNIPGTSLQVPIMANAAAQAPVPTVQTIFQNTQMKAMQAQQQPQPAPAPQPNGPQQPQAPKPPKQPGAPGPKPVNPSAPSANTPMGASANG